MMYLEVELQRVAWATCLIVLVTLFVGGEFGFVSLWLFSLIYFQSLFIQYFLVRPILEEVLKKNRTRKIFIYVSYIFLVYISLDEVLFLLRTMVDIPESHEYFLLGMATGVNILCTCGAYAISIYCWGKVVQLHRSKKGEYLV
jgi:surface polysaccharide O-acyltransferase-like enzyme